MIKPSLSGRPGSDLVTARSRAAARGVRRSRFLPPPSPTYISITRWEWENGNGRSVNPVYKKKRVRAPLRSAGEGDDPR